MPTDLAGDHSIPYLIVGALVFLAELLSFLKRHTQRQQNRHELISAAAASLIFVGVVTMALAKWVDYTTRASEVSVSSDFTQDYLAGRALSQGTAIYGPEFRKASLGIFPFPTDNYHPPFNALVFLPFSYLPYAWAFQIWSALSLAAYVATVVALLKAYGLYREPWWRISAFLLLWEPFTASVGLGQISALLAFVIIVGFLLLRNGWEKIAGALFAFAMLVKLFPGFLLLYLLLQRRWSAIYSFLMVSLTGILLTVATVGMDSVRYYVNSIIRTQHSTYADFPTNISIEGLLRTLFEATPYVRPLVAIPDYLPQLIWLANGSLVAFVLYLGARRRHSKNVDDLFSLMCISMLLVSPITWNHTCIVVLLPIFILLRDAILGAGRDNAYVAAIVLVLFSLPFFPIVNNVIGHYFPQPAPWHVLIVIKTGFWSLLLLWLVFSRRIVVSCEKLRR